MSSRRRLARGVISSALASVICFFAAPESADAQILKKLKERAEEAAEDESLNQIDLLVRDKVQCVFNDFECMESAAESGEEYVLTDPEGEVLVDQEGQPVSDPGQANEMMGGGANAPDGPPDLSTMQTGAAPGLEEADANFDFEPGERILYEEDYADDSIGDFPRSMNFRKGNWDIVEWNGQRWLRNTGPRHAALDIPLPEELPERFTIEFEAYFPHTNQQMIVSPTPPPPGKSYSQIEGNAFRVGVGGSRTGVIAFKNASVESMTNSKEVAEGPVPIRIMVDGQYAKMYVGSRRLANVPNASFTRSDRLYLENSYFANEEDPMLIGPIRIAAGGRDLYDVLEREGRFTARGINFDVNSANIRPESAETLAEIGSMLQEHPDLRLSIEGHTDADGDEEYNFELSKNRAAAVKQYLVERFGVASDRLQTEGFGEYVPVGPNETEDGKQLNRRVEIVRI